MNCNEYQPFTNMLISAARVARPSLLNLSAEELFKFLFFEQKELHGPFYFILFAEEYYFLGIKNYTIFVPDEELKTISVSRAIVDSNALTPFPFYALAFDKRSRINGQSINGCLVINMSYKEKLELIYAPFADYMGLPLPSFNKERMETALTFIYTNPFDQTIVKCGIAHHCLAGCLEAENYIEYKIIIDEYRDFKELEALTDEDSAYQFEIFKIITRVPGSDYDLSESQ